MYIVFRVKHQSVKRVDNHLVIADSKNYLKAKFEFSEDWGDIEKTVIFNNQTINLINDECLVPDEVIKSPGFTISVYGGNLITTTKLTIPVKPSGYKEIPPIQPINKAFTQMLNQVCSLPYTLEDLNIGGLEELDASSFGIINFKKGNIGAFKEVTFYNTKKISNNGELMGAEVYNFLQLEEIGIKNYTNRIKIGLPVISTKNEIIVNLPKIRHINNLFLVDEGYNKERAPAKIYIGNSIEHIDIYALGDVWQVSKMDLFIDIPKEKFNEICPDYSEEIRNKNITLHFNND